MNGSAAVDTQQRSVTSVGSGCSQKGPEDRRQRYSDFLPGRGNHLVAALF